MNPASSDSGPLFHEEQQVRQVWLWALLFLASVGVVITLFGLRTLWLKA